MRNTKAPAGLDYKLLYAKVKEHDSVICFISTSGKVGGKKRLKEQGYTFIKWVEPRHKLIPHAKS